MTKSFILAAAMALTLGSGAAMAQEGDAQNRYDGSPRVFNEYSHGAFETRPTWQANGAGRAAYSVQTQHLSTDLGSAGGGDGSAAN